MAGRHGGGEDGFALAQALGEALGGLDAVPEPPMPDLVSGAIVQGTRIRRRRRIGAALGSAAMAAVVSVGAYGVLAPTPETRRSSPAVAPTVWHPSLKLLRSIIPASTGTIEAAQPQYSRHTATHFWLTDPKTGLVSDLYVSVARSATGTSLLPASCRDGHGPELTTPLGGDSFKCSAIRTKSGDRVLAYFADVRSLPARTDDQGGSYTFGITHVTTGGWAVQALMGPHDESGKGHVVTASDWSVLTALATDPRIFDAVEETGS
ncbi:MULTISPECIES: hypothetical protein [Streptomyces]|uniref:hypothetical protein n=1 Tax=Streptomyces TaxID=1883 RepID=UPI00081AEBA8|nr:MULTISPECIES: hypothetical protein [unclassified Streptomyces]MYQ55658.1 hypothetical protein [Streptomyces sp. SID4941]SCE40686.1 hypothetical protein GA0115247_140613 [Streptomyces sp. PalvLS-984]SDC85043.1 hypothetical protein F558DRAFT_02747 [Streptomyces sp. AmelKG-A3]